MGESIDVLTMNATTIEYFELKLKVIKIDYFSMCLFITILVLYNYELIGIRLHCYLLWNFNCELRIMYRVVKVFN